jgi:hypothetical protein
MSCDTAAKRPPPASWFCAPPGVGRIVHAAQVHQLLEAQLGPVSQRARDREVVLGPHLQRQLAVLLGERDDALAECLLQGIVQALQPGGHGVPASSARWCWCA